MGLATTPTWLTGPDLNGDFGSAVGWLERRPRRQDAQGFLVAAAQSAFGI